MPNPSWFFPYTQENLPIKFNMNGADNVVVVRARIRERVSSLLEGDVFLQTGREIDLQAFIGEPCKLSIQYQEDTFRYFDGVISHASLTNMPHLDGDNTDSIIHLTFRSPLYLSNLGLKYRLFQDITTEDILRQILKENRISNVDINLRNAGQEMSPLCVQYHESDYQFFLRLSQAHGIFFYDSYSDGDSAFHLSDCSLSSPKIQTKLQILKMHVEGMYRCDMAFNVFRGMSAGTRQVDVSAFNEQKAEVMHGISSDTSLPFNLGEVENFDHLFLEKTDGDTLAKLELQRANSCSIQLKGRSFCPELSPGLLFDITGSKSSSHNGEFFAYDVEHVIEQFPNRGDGGPMYVNTFEAIPSSVPYVPPITQPSPRIYGCQTATTTGPEGEEVFCDDQGRIKIKFHWDFRSETDDKSSCWVRVSQSWAGPNFGALVTPRIGMEVVVVFLDGDPDQPLVTGCIYNGINPPPGNYPSDLKLASTFYSSSTNEVRINDEEEKEEIFIHAQKDINIVVEDSVTETLNIGSKITKLESNKDPVVHSLYINKGDKTEEIGEGNITITINKGNNSITLGEGDSETSVTGNVVIKATKDITFSCDGVFKVDAAKGIELGTQTNISLKAQQNFEVTCLAWKAEAQTTIEFKALSMKFDATANFEIGAAMFNASATASITISSQAAANISAAILSLSGSAGASLSGAMVKLG
ncbi:MAG: type VI secretion system tip protein VgrG [Holosporales bacterium]|jgi:type VI secretion system secreted protein VgrG|nr:type VI secretion system tip protein VgrG [Holosporales bacterium]